LCPDRRSGADRRSRVDRRAGEDRRTQDTPVAIDRRQGDRRKGERRRQVDPTTCEKRYSDDELEFMNAIEQYKRRYNRPFPTWTEVLEVVCKLGYAKVASAEETAQTPVPVEPITMPADQPQV
jgi:hypothetical protein